MCAILTNTANETVILYRGDLNESGNFNAYTKLVMHGYKLLSAILTEIRTLQKRNYLFDLLRSKD